MRQMVCAIVILLAAAAAPGQGRSNLFAAPGQGLVNLPYNVNDNSGNTWSIQARGYLRQQGNMPLYSQGAALTVNNGMPSVTNNQARLDNKTGEIIFEGANTNGVSVTRRILVNRENSYVRYIDVFRNNGAQELSVRVQISTNFNYGTQSSQAIIDPKHKDKILGYAVMLDPGKAVMELYGMRGVKDLPLINQPANNNVIQASMTLNIPAGKQVALLHLHGIAASAEAAAQFAANAKESQILAGVPAELRRIIINATAQQSIGDSEVLRGELFDVVELRGGDQLKGTLTEPSYKLETFYGAVELPAARVVGLINVGQFRPRQLVVTVDGEVFGGSLGKPSIEMQLSSGQKTQIPLAQIARFGYRKRSGEPEEWKFDRPMIALRSGDRMVIAMPTDPIEILTRYGLFKLAPQSIAMINFQSEEHGVHQITLPDGSRFAGLATAQTFDMQLLGTASPQSVSFPAASVGMIQLNKLSGDAPADDAPVLDLTNEDQLIGILSGKMQLDTNFDTLSINASEIRSMTHLSEGGSDVQVTLWDETTLSGQLHEPQVSCDLRSGLSVKIPVALISAYSNPLPQPSGVMVDRIKAVVAQLSADDWKDREAAEAQLVAMGPLVIPVLKQLVGTVSPEAQQRIESVLKQFGDKKTPAAGGGSEPAMIFNKD